MVFWETMVFCVLADCKKLETQWNISKTLFKGFHFDSFGEVEFGFEEVVI